MSETPLTGERERRWSLLSHSVPRVSHPAAGRVYGHVQVSPRLLPLPPTIRLGWFLTLAGADMVGPRFAEGRIQLISTDAPDRFAFTADAAAIADAHGAPLATLWIDLVQEGEFWFCDLDWNALRIDLAMARPLLGSPLGAGLLQRALSTSGDLELLGTIQAAEQRHHIGESLRRGLLASEGLLPASAPRRRTAAPAEAVTAGLRQQAAGMPGSFGAGTVAGAQPRQLLAALLAQEPWPAFELADADYFQRSRVEHNHLRLPLTSAMLDALATQSGAAMARAFSSPDALRHWWLFDIVLPHPLPAEALPHDHRRYWQRLVVADAIAPANRYVAEAWEQHQARHPGQGGSLHDAADRLAFQLSLVLESWTDHRRLSLLGDDAISFWAQRVAFGGRFMSLFTLLAAMAAEVEDAADAVAAEQTLLSQVEKVEALVAEQCPALMPLLDQGSARRAQQRRQPVYLIGQRHALGMGQALRLSAEALGRLGVATRIFDADEAQPLIVTPSGRLLPWQPGHQREAQAPAEGFDKPISLFFCGADAMRDLLRSQTFSGVTARNRVGAFPWAFADVPPTQAAGLKEVDALWAPTDFVRQAFARTSNRPLATLGVPLSLPENLPDPYPELLPDRASTFVFFSAFNPAAGLRRKNPSAAISGFIQAFPNGTEPVALVLRMPDGGVDELSDPYGEWSLIQQAAARDPRIILLEERGSDERALSFVRHADAIVSAHRSEAFGLLCAQAHYYARPLIATGYSGNMDFCNPDNSWLLDFKLRDVQPGELPFDIRTQWADVKIDHVAVQMLAVLHQRDRAAERAQRGQALVREIYAPAHFDQKLREQLGAL
ncbi:glycosyltransferase family 1 protein [Rhodovarius crocodyli]|uniref:Glycosyltransferase family 1 protein n=1 Tax=Rhodovarius crocodyli TaxID=1979269 RepID=A0A437MDB8_9PROT|nr:glycosyltransferase [Rhodovarius crocodyli]RVT95649.1 glycosyltransferase family 1 protein [Rhodovarius crocodyli]